jgi:hypothetical protein
MTRATQLRHFANWVGLLAAYGDFGPAPRAMAIVTLGGAPPLGTTEQSQFYPSLGSNISRYLDYTNMLSSRHLMGTFPSDAPLHHQNKTFTKSRIFRYNIKIYIYSLRPKKNVIIGILGQIIKEVK